MNIVKGESRTNAKFKSIIDMLSRSEILRPTMPLLALLIIASLIVPEKFWSVSNAKIVLLQVTPLAAIATGEMLVILTGGIDLTPGSALGFTAMISALTYLSTNNFYLSLIVAIFSGLIIGVLNGLLVTKFKIFSFVATLAGLAIWRALTLFISGGKLIYGLQPYEIFALSLGNLIPLGFVMIILVETVIYLLLKKTVFGRYLYAIGSNEEAVRLSGVKADLVKLIAFTLAGLMYGFGGILTIGMAGLAVDPWTGNGFELNAIASCVMGGIMLTGGVGSPVGAFLGSLLLTLLNNILILMGYTEFYIRQIITATVLILAATALSRGLKYVK